MNIISRVIAALRNRSNRNRAMPARTASALVSMSPRDYFDLLKAYYLNNGLYDEIRSVLRALNIYHESLKPLRNPAYRIVEFYASKLWGGELQIVSKNENITPAIQQVWKWSNWATQRQVFARWLATYGNTFTKIAQTDDGERVFYQNIEPQFVTDFKNDERGYLTFVRIDTPVEPNAAALGTEVPQILKWLTRTEVWDKESGSYRVWEQNTQGDAPIEKLGAPTLTKPLSDFGIDFIPIVHTKLRDIGEKRGVGAFVMALDKIDEANLVATRLHQTLFRNNRNLWALKANAQTADGRPLPPPNVSLEDDSRGTDPLYELGEDRMIRLPGNTELQSLVPNLRYLEALEVLRDQMNEIEKDCPELAYYRIREMRDPSGKAVRLLLTDATDRLLEARSNAEAALVRLDEMALTIGANARLKGFTNLGTFEAGSFEHSFGKRDVIPVSEAEMAENIKAETSADIPLETAARRNGWSEDDIKQMEEDRAKADARDLAHAESLMKVQTPPNPVGAGG